MTRVEGFARWALVTMFALLAVAATASATEYAWLEGENPAETNYVANTDGRGMKRFMTGGTWLAVYASGGKVADLPGDGVLLRYDFELDNETEHEVWARLGYGPLRTGFDWRIDGGEWNYVAPTAWGRNATEIAPWCPLEWLKLDTRDLDDGEHSITFRVKPWQDPEKGDRAKTFVRFALDTICVYPGEFRPNAWYRPDDESWYDEEAKAAAEKVFRMPEARGDGGRVRHGLAGLWQVARYDEEGLVENRTEPIAATPDPAELRWTAMEAPGDRNALRPDLKMARRFFYRTRVHIPQSHEGRRLLLHFESTSLMATVFVNGQRVGFQDLPFVPWECDITEAVRYGEENEIWVGIKDWAYAFSGEISGRNTRHFFNRPTNMSGAAPVDYAFRTGGGFRTGFVEKVEMVSVGDTYVKDVFAKPSVGRKRLDLEIDLDGTDQPVVLQNRVVPHGGHDAALQFANLRLDRPRDIKASSEWQNPHLWWPDAPYLYDVVTTLTRDGRVIDEKRTTFGFREWTVKGDQFLLNGVPQHLHADLRHYGYSARDVKKGITLDDVFEDWREAGINTFRFRFQAYWGGMGDGEVLDEFDRRGILVRREVARLDGQVFNTAIWYKHPETGKSGPNMPLMRNWRRQAAARVRAERNHPSIVLWETDNESLMLWGMGKAIREGMSPEWGKTSDMILEMDPTRSVLSGGGVAGVGEVLPIYGVHYFGLDPREYPDEAYSLEKTVEYHRQKRGFPITLGKKPIFMSEEYYAPGKPDAWFAAVGGESVFTGRGAVREAADLMGRIYSEGYRWSRVAAWHFWGTFGEETYTSWQPVACFSRRWNWTLPEGQTLERTFGVFNDTRHEDPITVGLKMTVGETVVLDQARPFRVARGGMQEFTVDVSIPQVAARTTGQLSITCSRRGEVVFRDTRQVAVLDGDAPVELGNAELAVYDPHGAVLPFLEKHGIENEPLASLQEVPDDADVLLVGPDAWDAEGASNQALMTRAAGGMRIVVLEQSHPLSASALPSDSQPTEYSGSVEFATDPGHPVIDGLAQEDFFTWAGQGHEVYRRAYRKASRGALPLLHCDYGVDYTPLTLQPVNEGMVLLCQLAVAEKLAVEPAARRVLVNMLNYAAGYSLPSRPVATAIEDRLKIAALDDTGLVYQKGEDPIELMESGRFEIVIVEATPENMAALANAKNTVNRWAGRGNWLMVWGVDPGELGDFNELVGFEHLIRPFRLEKVTKAGTDSLSAGLPAGALQVMTAHKFHRHTGQTYRDWNLFSHIVDYRDVAPFAEWPNPSYFGHEGDPEGYTAAADNLPMNMVNGMTEEDYWVYGFSIHLFDNDPTEWTIELPRKEELEEFSIVMNKIYHEVTEMRLVFDGDEDSAMVVSPDTTGARQDFDLGGREAKSITIELTDWNPRGSRDVIGVGNIWLTARRSDEFLRRVTPLVNPAGLVRYDVGEGGIVLNQLKIMQEEPVAVNADKKRAILTTLLRNMGAGFSSARVVLPGMDLQYEPVFMKDYVNLFLDKEHNWPDQQADLSLMPLGNQQFLGVDYQVYDYATALFPHAVTLKGVVKEPAGGTELAEAVRGMKVGRKADALFLLHTLLPGQAWKPRRTKGARRKELPPVVFRYVVNYKDGKSQTVPVRLKHDVDTWLQRNPEDLPDARLAWSGKGPRNKRSGVWQMIWSNPRPGVAIESVDLEYGPDGAQWGSPVLFAITVARER